MKKRILGGAVAAFMVLPAFGGAIPTAAAGEPPEPTRIDVAAEDYHFMLTDGSDFPKELTKGRYRFAFKNLSEKRVHEIVLFKLRHGKTVRQILNMPEKKAQRHIRFKGFSFAKPGKRGRSFEAKLIQGRYAMLCFVQNRKNAAPHFTKGMIHRFRTVP